MQWGEKVMKCTSTCRQTNLHTTHWLHFNCFQRVPCENLLLLGPIPSTLCALVGAWQTIPKRLEIAFPPFYSCTAYTLFFYIAIRVLMHKRLAWIVLWSITIRALLPLMLFYPLISFPYCKPSCLDNFNTTGRMMQWVQLARIFPSRLKWQLKNINAKILPKSNTIECRLAKGRELFAFPFQIWWWQRVWCGMRSVSRRWIRTTRPP